MKLILSFVWIIVVTAVFVLGHIFLAGFLFSLFA